MITIDFFYSLKNKPKKKSAYYRTITKQNFPSSQ